MSKPLHNALLAILCALLLASCDSAGRRAAMTAVLDRADSLNRNYIPITTDSLLREAADYFDSHGTPNERLRAHYLLGCAYRDMGEAPRAIQCFQDAISTVDTINPDCDYRILSAVYSQMARLYHKMFLFINAEDAYKQSSHFSLMIKDTLYAAYDLEMAAGSLILQNKMNEAESMLNEAMRLYDCCHATQDRLQCSVTLMYLYLITENEHEKIRHIIENYETKSVLFSGNSTLPDSKRQYYYYKGLYYEQMNLLDSAEYCYRQVFYHGMPAISQVPMYKGLLSIYKKRNVTDSIAKYAELYCLANDSSLSIKDQEITAQSAATYNYSRLQKKAFENEERANRAHVRIILILLFSFIIFLLGLLSIYHLRRNQQRRIEEIKLSYANAKEKYLDNLHTLQLLTNDNGKLLISKAELTAENERLKKQIDHLKECKDLSPYVQKVSSFFNLPVVMKIRQRIEKSNYSLIEDEWSELMSEFAKHFPLLMNDLSNLNGITQQKQKVCMLVILQFRSADIAHVMNVIPQRITNIKEELNQELFKKKTARSLYSNLVNRYNIIV